MTELPAPERIAVIWSPEARVDLRAIDRETAMQILHCVDRYLASRSGDVKKLKPPRTGFRLRCGDYRVFCDQKNDTTITSAVGFAAVTDVVRLSAWNYLWLPQKPAFRDWQRPRCRHHRWGPIITRTSLQRTDVGSSLSLRSEVFLRGRRCVGLRF
jgi:mRNA-degrading endonuclease RelE of RelBE toxin-antitoxin system